VVNKVFLAQPEERVKVNKVFLAQPEERVKVNKYKVFNIQIIELTLILLNDQNEEEN